MKLGEQAFDLKDLLEIDQDSNYRVWETPIGAPPGKTVTVVGRAVPWKGVKGRAFREQFPEIARNIEKAQAVASRHEGVQGMAVLRYPNGETVQMPARAAEMAVDAHGDYGVEIVGRSAAKKPWAIA